MACRVSRQLCDSPSYQKMAKGSVVVAKRKREQKPMPKAQAAFPPKAAVATLCIRSLPYSTCKQDVAMHFADAAGMSVDEFLPSCRLLLCDGRFKGTAFVDMRTWEAVDKGCALNGKIFTAADGAKRPMQVRETVPKTQLQKQQAAEEMARKARGAAVAAKDAENDAKRATEVEEEEEED
eukprot:2970215-Prymnesium_polylepis.1